MTTTPMATSPHAEKWHSAHARSATCVARGAPVAPPELRASGVRFVHPGASAAAVDGVDLDVEPGAVTAIIGPNGCGKSTLLRAVRGLVPLAGGRVTRDGRDVADVPAKALARQIAFLPQHPVVPAGTTVAELAARGRHPHRGWFGRWTVADDAAVAEALEVTGTRDLVDRGVGELSGGQRQRVWLALVLAQQAPVLLLDEPTSFLDLAHQIDVLDVVRRLGSTGTTIVMVLHDLALAARYADRIVAMHDGRVVAQGEPADVLTPAVLERTLGLTVQVVPDPVTGTPLVVPAHPPAHGGRAPRPIAQEPR